MNKYYLLKENIRNSNLSDLDKQTLIEIISQQKVDMNAFLLAFLRLIKVGDIISDFFDIDFGD